MQPHARESLSSRSLIMTLDKVSIIVPVYQVEQFIEQCAASVFSQTWENLEVVFVDNCSPDRSMDLIRELLEKSFPHMKEKTVFVREESRGLGYARAAGLRASSGDYIIHVDSDDWVEPSFIAHLMAKMRQDDADVVYCDWVKEYESKPSRTAYERDLPGTDPASVIFAIHNGGIQAYMWNKLVKRSLIDMDRLIIPVKNMHEDLVFQTQILCNSRKTVHLKEPLYHYRRRRKGAITAGNWRSIRYESAVGLFHFYDKLPKASICLGMCEQDLLMRAGWYAMSTLHPGIISSYPRAKEFLAGMSYVRGRRVPLIKQRLLRLWCRL